MAQGRFLNLVGMTFGFLVALRRGENSHRGHPRWICKCKCGKEALVSGECLRRGSTTSCGCRRSPDLTGRIFERLTPLFRTKNSKGQAKWHCRCSCGNELDVLASSLASGKTRSCGCLADDLTSQRQKAARMERGGNWKGGRTVDQYGYVLVLKPGHPNANKRGYVREHVWKMSEREGRRIDTKREEVHHINGIHGDNRIENLELKALGHGRGQSVTDIINYILDFHQPLYEEMKSRREGL